MVSPIRVCVFDAYGTLFDVHSAVALHAGTVGPKAEEVSKLWRAKQLEYTWTRTLMGRHADFWAVTGEALDVALAAFGIGGGALRGSLLDAYRRLAAYPEVPDALTRLRAAGMKTAILSNGTPAMLNDAVQAAGIAALLDAVLSIEEIGIYKTSTSSTARCTSGSRSERTCISPSRAASCSSGISRKSSSRPAGWSGSKP